MTQTQVLAIELSPSRQMCTCIDNTAFIDTPFHFIPFHKLSLHHIIWNALAHQHIDSSTRRSALELLSYSVTGLAASRKTYTSAQQHAPAASAPSSWLCCSAPVVLCGAGRRIVHVQLSSCIKWSTVVNMIGLTMTQTSRHVTTYW